MAYKSPITVNYGQRQLAIINREQVSKLFMAIHYLELVIKVCDEIEKQGKSGTLPWVEELSRNDMLQFHKELLSSTMKSVVTNNWEQLEYLIQDWKATAEVESNPKLAKALLEKDKPKEYVKLKD